MGLDEITEYTYKVLVVDDQPDNLMTFVNFLEEINPTYEVYQATNGKMAVMIAQKKTPDIIIMDWEMPEMDGIEAIKELKKDETTKDIPVIMATGKMTTPEHLKTAFDAGAIDFLAKPVDKIELAARVQSMLKLSQSFKKIKQLNENKDRFFGIIGHDLRSPIGNISNALELLATNYDSMPKEQYMHFIEIAKNATFTTHNLLENLLYWGYCQKDTLELKKSEFSVTDIVLEVMMLFTKKIEDKKLKMSVKIENEIIAFADRNLISTILRNLINNAVKFTNEGDKIVVSAMEENGAVYIDVSDTGIGMSQDDIKKINNRESFTTSGTQHEKGTGLGFSLIHEFLDAHGTKLNVTSEKGKGSLFSFSLETA